MNNNYIKLAITLFLFVLVFNSCKETPPFTVEDRENPTILMTAPQEVPLGQYVNLYNNQDIFFDIRFQDDVELDRYEISIYWDISLNFLDTNDYKVMHDAWEHFETARLDGRSDGINKTITIKGDPTAGPYVMDITVWDMVGKRDTIRSYFYITNSGDDLRPVISYAVPDTNEVDTFELGVNIPLEAWVSDNQLLSEAYFHIKKLPNRDILPGRDIVYDTVFAPFINVDTFFNFDSVAVVPAGNYVIEGFARDLTFNYGRNEVQIYVRP